MAIVDGVAYGEPFETATADVRLEGDGVRLDNIEIVKGGGRGTGAAYVGWNGTYSFNFDARGIPVESIALAQLRAACRCRASSTSPPAAAARSTRRATTCAAPSATSSSPTKASARSSATSTSAAS